MRTSCSDSHVLQTQQITSPPVQTDKNSSPPSSVTIAEPPNCFATLIQTYANPQNLWVPNVVMTKNANPCVPPLRRRKREGVSLYLTLSKYNCESRSNTCILSPEELRGVPVWQYILITITIFLGGSTHPLALTLSGALCVRGLAAQ